MTYRILGIILTTTATAAACSHAPEATTKAARPPVAVTTTHAAVRDLPATFEAGGIVRARVTAAIASRVMAPVTDVHVHPGDRVRRGAPLVSLDARELLANRDRAAAAAAAARESSAAAEADVAAAESNVVLARVTHQRVAELASKKSATPQELDQAVAALSAAEAQLRAAQARRAAADAGREAARAAHTAADTGLSYTQLTAPFDGVVIDRAVDPGAMATPGMPLLTVEDPSSFRLEVRVDEARAQDVRVGQPVEVSFGAEPGAAPSPAWAPAHVVEIARVDPASHAFVVKIDLPAGVGARSGGFGRARFSGPTRKALTVPASALVRRGQLAFVFAVGPDNVARLRAVSAGAAGSGDVEALAGVADGELLVVDPPPGLADGSPVQATTAVARGEAR